MDVGPGRLADAIADAVDEGPDVVLDPPLLLVDLLRRHDIDGGRDLLRRRNGTEAELGQRLGQSRLDAGQVANLRLLGDVWMETLVETGVGEVVAGIERGGGVERIHSGTLAGVRLVYERSASPSEPAAQARTRTASRTE